MTIEITCEREDKRSLDEIEAGQAFYIPGQPDNIFIMGQIINLEKVVISPAIDFFVTPLKDFGVDGKTKVIEVDIDMVVRGYLE
ncbi:MAG: hypothetical protein CMI54_01710 [Parcubacteria group bacterium]|nr:hypothetical protein [Parcubacteria group bacterium]|tara:strand:- start:17498 stop:17749 length:252 start_codon:yes stop_codon:yes gene_type:complete